MRLAQINEIRQDNTNTTPSHWQQRNSQRRIEEGQYLLGVGAILFSPSGSQKQSTGKIVKKKKGPQRREGPRDDIGKSARDVVYVACDEVVKSKMGKEKQKEEYGR